MTPSALWQFFDQQSSTTLTERMTCTAEIIHACGVCQFRATNQHQQNVLSRSSLHSVSDAGHAPNSATWRPQLRLQMFALPVPSERDLRLIIGCLTARRVSVPAALGVLHRLQEPQSVPCGKEATLKRFFRCVICPTEMDVIHRCAEG